MVSMMDILPGAVPQMVDVRQSGSGPVRHAARPSRRMASTSAGAGSPATARAANDASPTTPTDVAHGA